MLKSLRSRLLFSYVLVVLVALLLVAIAFVAIGVQPSVRYFTPLQELDALSRTSRNELNRLRLSGADTQTLLQVLDNTAVENNVRILVANANDLNIIYDSDPSDSWMGVTLEGVEFPRRLLPSTDEATVAGRFRHPDGSIWLLYTRALSNRGFGGQLVIYAVPEPSPLAFFNQFDLGNVLLGAGVVALLVSIFLAWLITRSVTRPLQEMAVAAEGIAQGEYAQQLALQGPQEVQSVARSFNSMAEQVAATRNSQRDFVANVSHDLKTPITSIRGWSQALLDGTAVSQTDQQQAVKVIYDESERMERMVSQLLDLAKIESGQIILQREPVDLGNLLLRVYHSLDIRAQEKEVTLATHFKRTALISGDPDRLTQIFTNLVDNALTHTEAGGRVDIGLRPYHNNAVEVAIKDTGRGIAPDELMRVFERFYQVDKSRVHTNGKGTGLGLAIVQELVSLHNGRILAHSELGQGSTFIVRLPVQENVAETMIGRRGENG